MDPGRRTRQSSDSPAPTTAFTVIYGVRRGAGAFLDELPSTVFQASEAALVRKSATRDTAHGAATTKFIPTPEALIRAAQRESGVTTPTGPGLLTLAMLAPPDPAAKFLTETRGALGPDHRLDY